MSYADWVEKARKSYPVALADWKATLAAARTSQVALPAKALQDFWKANLNLIGHKIIFQIINATDFETNTLDQDRIKLKFEL